MSISSESDRQPASPEASSAEAPEVVIVGAGPAGLTAAYQLAKAGHTSTVLEGDDVVGGISRSVERDGWRFDIGGHRFFTKVPEVEALWHEILPDEDFLLRPRMSRIFYDGKYYDYPLKASNALRNLGVIEAFRCVLSYAWARVRPPKDQSKFEQWVAARFGYRLYRHFFKTYTEKVWGVPATELSADFAAQRIKNLSLSKAIINALLPKRNQKEITSLIEEFQYPKYGPGMMWERCRDKVEAAGTKVLMRSGVRRIRHRGGKAVAVVAETDGVETSYPCTEVISSMPMPALLRAMDPPVPDEVNRAAADLQFRDFLTVALVVPESAGFPDNWIYIHAPTVKVGRIQNFGSWSPYMIKEGRTCLGLEYFVFEGDGMWTMPDDELVELGKRELVSLGLLDDPSVVESGYVVRMPKAYPTYDETYTQNVDVLRAWLAANAPNVHPVGRNGMHKYNNQDHSMYTAMLTVENILGAHHDIWNVNVEAEYHEQKATAAPGSGGTGRDAPVLPRRTGT
ncbi:MAG: NAD(P)/FAD-dependent oxidoreductase [Actinomycetota bacterium]|nr:NAD(P)/FAD-dependent oxidoreductase [Actinomycetota bacterium]